MSPASGSSDAPASSGDRAGHLVLVGLMGTGKTTVGQHLSERLGRPLVDTDELVEVATGRSIHDLFSTKGEAAFRRYELDSLTRALAREEPSVIATGGGVVTTAEARHALRTEVVVWLRASPETLAERLDGDATRPLLGGRNPLEVLRELSEHRKGFYQEVATATVESDGCAPDKVADEVLDVLGWAP
jgi:shikimate kinase